MTPQEIIDLLSICAGYDQRTVGQGDVESWRLALEDPRVPNLSYDEAVDAVIMHYRDQTDFVKPAHILQRVKSHRASNLAQIMPPTDQHDPEAYARIGTLWRQQYADAEQRRKDRRTAVLAHPDLAERLTQPPLSYERPEQWNGGIPPKYGPEDAAGRVKPYASPRRDALVEICEEAARRNGSPA